MDNQHSESDSPGSASPFTWTLRVYYEDTDAGGVVFYANYLKFFERARTEWLRACGADQSALAAASGLIFIVRSTTMDYRSPARLDDTVRVVSRVERMGRASVDFVQSAYRGDTLLVNGSIRVACVERDAFKPSAIPEHIRQALSSWSQSE